MTGFGGASTRIDGAQYLVEIRSLNNRWFKCHVRLPEELQGLEPEIESTIASRIPRGSVTVTVRFSDHSAAAAVRLNVPAIEQYLEQLRGVSGGEDLRAPSSLLGLPGVLITDTGLERIERARPVIKALLDEAADELGTMRQREGGVLQEELGRRCDEIASHCATIEEHSPRVVEQYQERLRRRMASLLEANGMEARQEDVLREVAVYAERTDVAEELVRLAAHIEQFREILSRDGDEPVGRTLDFLSQEMLREANTISSKALDTDISRAIVEVKSAIDRIKEQVQNVE